MATDYSLFLRRGKENATPAVELARAAGYESIRSLQKDISLSRAEGQVICSTPAGGYYLPADRAEIEEFIRTMEARAKNTLRAIRSARDAISHLEGQLSMDLQRADGL